jgi:cytochrome c oxidase assembly protein subunit 15
MSLLRRVAGLTLVLTFALIVLGAWVRATNSGLSCPDWPTCYGHWLPLPSDIPADVGYSYFQVMLEWVHRLIAGVFVGPLILVIGWLCWRVRGIRPQMPAYALTLVALLLAQAGLGGVTVLDQNSPWSVALHLGTALLLFTTLWLIFVRAGPEPVATPDGIGPLAATTWLLAFATLVSAAVMAKSGASLACASWPLCNQNLIPDLADPYVRLNVTHRLLALGFLVAAGLLWLRLRRGPAPGLGWLVLGLTIAEIGLGGWLVALALPVWSGVLHQALGVLTFAAVTHVLWRTVGGRDALRREDAGVRLSEA